MREAWENWDSDEGESTVTKGRASRWSGTSLEAERGGNWNGFGRENPCRLSGESGRIDTRQKLQSFREAVARGEQTISKDICPAVSSPLTKFIFIELDADQERARSDAGVAGAPRRWSCRGIGKGGGRKDNARRLPIRCVIFPWNT